MVVESVSHPQVGIWSQRCESGNLTEEYFQLFFFDSAVYFNPAKTIGAMLEADLFCLLGLFYSSLVCSVSMSMYWWLELKPGWEWLADVVAVAWIGLSMSGVAWMKAWMVRRKATLRTVVPSNVNGRTTDRSTLVSSLTASAFHIY